MPKMKRKTSFEKVYDANDAYIERFDEKEINHPIKPVYKVIGIFIIIFLIINPYSQKFFFVWNAKYLNKDVASLVGKTQQQIVQILGEPITIETHNGHIRLVYETITADMGDKGKCFQITAPAKTILKDPPEKVNMATMQMLFKESGEVTDAPDGGKISTFKLSWYRVSFFWDDTTNNPTASVFQDKYR